MAARTKSEDYDRIETEYGKMGDIRSIANPDDAQKKLKAFLDKYNPDGKNEPFAKALIEGFHKEKHDGWVEKHGSVNATIEGVSLTPHEQEVYSKVIGNMMKLREEDPKALRYQDTGKRRTIAMKRDDLSKINYQELADLDKKTLNRLVTKGAINDDVAKGVEVLKAFQDVGIKPTKKYIVAYTDANDVYRTFGGKYWETLRDKGAEGIANTRVKEAEEWAAKVLPEYEWKNKQWVKKG